MCSRKEGGARKRGSPQPRCERSGLGAGAGGEEGDLQPSALKTQEVNPSSRPPPGRVLVFGRQTGRSQQAPGWGQRWASWEA